MVVKIRSSKSFDEFVRLVTWKGDAQQVDLFINIYNRKLTNQLKDMIVYLMRFKN